MSAIKGIIWCKSVERRIEKLKTIILNYSFSMIGYEYVAKSYNGAGCKFSNGDIWEVVIAGENQRGRICNISYIEYGVDKQIIDNIIIPSTIDLPFHGYSYF